MNPAFQDLTPPTEFTLRGARLALGVMPGPLELEGDAEALEQLFLNLLINAAQALADGGTARVEAERRARRIVSNHHGKLGVTSALGRGTTVQVTLPTLHPQGDGSVSP